MYYAEISILTPMLRFSAYLSFFETLLVEQAAIAKWKTTRFQIAVIQGHQKYCLENVLGGWGLYLAHGLLLVIVNSYTTFEFR